MSLGRVEEAERALRVALELDPDLASAHGNLGILLTNRGSWEEARRHLDRALELRPDVIAFRLNLGLLFAKSGRLDEAREVFEGVLADRPDDPVALRSLATLRRLGAGD
jgi:Flp pilus assembly protein TadD